MEQVENFLDVLMGHLAENEVLVLPFRIGADVNKLQGVSHIVSMPPVQHDATVGIMA